MMIFPKRGAGFVSRLRLPGALALRDQFPHLRHELMRDPHHRLGGLNAGLILSHCFVLALTVIVCEDLPHFAFIPIWWKLGVAHCCFFFLRLLKAARGFPVSS